MTDKGKQADTSETVATNDNQSAFSAVMPVIADLLEVGTRAFALGNWEEAIENFGELSSITEQTFGSESQRYADCLVMYGRALLQHAIEQNALLAQKALAEAATGNSAKDEDQDVTPSKANINFEGEPDFREVEGFDQKAADSGMEEGSSSKGKQVDTGTAVVGNEEDVEEEEEQDDFAAAWDILDLARVIQEKESDSKTRLKYAETLMLLGDVSMESENFAQAVNDFSDALNVKLQYLDDDNRELAELYYKVALAHEYNNDTAKALDLMKDVQRILGNRLKNLEISDKPEDKEDVTSLKEVLEDVAAKVEEWKSPPKPVDLSAMTSEESAVAERAKLMFKQAMESGNIKDISNLVKPNKKRTEAEQADANGKPGATDVDSKRAKGNGGE
ncbi:hypothetical protein COEREDRAFT_8698 [Coemansia reversa NRRL 1564]|uniref:Tetratricopeptide SHNi-TPR domain-containing protein n=1 Tax=Coemansia reversa (strain ATCC 12441 / NRRL 1564) TaxID=763665 RepID=A0A2G5BAJ7_COERN|nr:hypothetical protein COEREDRAFT_8698 [Coemansia reversa NRRL 1564]|eukprot:PIA16033.1 hypothetical protein COEREDRAFT_8698 [Coemansia reversa NRRL 1564]